MLKFNLFYRKQRYFELIRSAKDIKINKDDYELVYSGEIYSREKEGAEFLFNKFNIMKPDDFNNRSMCVGDIVEVDDIYYLCLTLGWEKIEF